MYIHLIAYALIDDKKIAYHFASTDFYEVKKERQKMVDLSNKKDSFDYSIHILKTNSPDFSSVIELDSYFAGCEEYNDIYVFFNEINHTLQLNSLDVYSFLKNNSSLYPFELQKVMYYIYSHFLSIGKKTFTAEFVVFDKGPVDKNVYRIAKYEDYKLKDNVSFDQKVSSYSNEEIKEFMSFIFESIDKYGDYYCKSWDNEMLYPNLTHNKGTPWYRAKMRGSYNSPITDEDIKKYHYLETF